MLKDGVYFGDRAARPLKGGLKLDNMSVGCRTRLPFA